MLSLTASFTLVSCNGGSTSTETKADDADYMYQCPMHPEATSDKPAKCPKCGMDEERIKKVDMKKPEVTVKNDTTKKGKADSVKAPAPVKKDSTKTK